MSRKSDDKLVFYCKSFSHIILYGLIVTSIGFGLFKQAKTAALTTGDFFHISPQAGSDARALRDEFLRIRGFRGPSITRLSYLSDRVDGPGLRPAREYFYDAQYGFAPETLAYLDPAAEFYLLDFSTDQALSEAMARHSLETVSRRGTCVLAVRRTL